MSTPQPRSQQIPPSPQPAAAPQTDNPVGGAQDGRTWGLDDRSIEPDLGEEGGGSAATRT